MSRPYPFEETIDVSSRQVSRAATSISGRGSQTATESISCGISRDYSLYGGDGRVAPDAIVRRCANAQSLSAGGHRTLASLAGRNEASAPTRALTSLDARSARPLARLLCAAA